MKIVQTAQGARVMHGRHVLSEIRRELGPTHSLFDVLAAAMVVGMPSPDGRVGMLGFAGGGVVGPLRRLGLSQSLHCVDLDTQAVPIFRALTADWAGTVQVARADAVRWLGSQSRPFDVLLEDLSQQIPGDVVKPQVSFHPLPKLIHAALAPKGVAVINALPEPKSPMVRTVRKLVAPFRQVLRIRMDAFANEVLVAGRSLPDAAVFHRQVRLALWTMGSKLAEEFAVTRLR